MHCSIVFHNAIMVTAIDCTYGVYMAKPVQLANGTCFKTQSEAKSHFKAILNANRHQAAITPHDEEFSDVLALYKQHPEFHWKTKDEHNVKEFIIKNTGQFKTRCFHVVHHDGSLADWSYITAISGQLKSQFECFADGARHLLSSGSYEFRDPNFKVKCISFIESRGFTINSIPSKWISAPDKLQYHSSLTECISKEFVDWYERNE